MDSRFGTRSGQRLASSLREGCSFFLFLALKLSHVLFRLALLGLAAMVWFGDCFSLLIQWCAFDVVIHLRTDIATNLEARRTDIQFLARICNRLGRYHTSFSWQGNLHPLVEHGQLCFRSLNFSLWSSLRCVSPGALKFLQDNKYLHGNVALFRLQFGQKFSLYGAGEVLARLLGFMLPLLSLSSVSVSSLSVVADRVNLYFGAGHLFSPVLFLWAEKCRLVFMSRSGIRGGVVCNLLGK